MSTHSKDDYASLVERAVWEIEQAEGQLMRLITQTDHECSHTAYQGEGWYLFDPEDSPSLQETADWLVRTGRGVRGSDGRSVWVHTGTGARTGLVTGLEDMLAEVIACAAPFVRFKGREIIVRSGRSPVFVRAMRWLAARGRAKIVEEWADGSVAVSMPDPVLYPEVE